MSEQKKSIISLVATIMGEVGAIGKNRKNLQQGYAFRGIDDIYLALQGLLSKYQVVIFPCVLEYEREEREAKNGGVLNYTILKVQFTFMASDGSFFESVTMGEAMDSGDKSCNKAMSAAMKYAMLQVFCIPTEEPKDTEIETHEIKSTAVIKRDPPIKTKPLPTPEELEGQARLKQLNEAVVTSKWPQQKAGEYMQKNFKTVRLSQLSQEQFQQLITVILGSTPEQALSQGH